MHVSRFLTPCAEDVAKFRLNVRTLSFRDRRLLIAL